jgi:hypothetical protein
MLLQSRGFRLSAVGGLLILISAISMVLLPDYVAGAGMVVGACAVGGGFMWTMAEFYVTPQQPPDA